MWTVDTSVGQFEGLESAVLALQLVKIEPDLALIFENSFKIRLRFHIFEELEPESSSQFD